ncbi:MAG: hypothetical protein ACRBB3_06430 [Alphaproteobacteria bacterium]
MKKFAVFIFVFVFAVNTASINAYAFSCTLMAQGQNVDAVAMADCHEMMKTDKNASGSSHCEGFCFCQSVLQSSHIMPLDLNETVMVFVKDMPPVSFDNLTHSVDSSPLLRPPILIS